jgi:hypothetical protein
MTVGLKDILTSLRRAGTLGEPAGANKLAYGRSGALIEWAMMRPLFSLFCAIAAIARM